MKGGTKGACCDQRFQRPRGIIAAMLGAKKGDNAGTRSCRMLVIKTWEILGRCQLVEFTMARAGSRVN